MLVLPIPDPDIPEQHEPWCPLGKKKLCDMCLNALFITNVLVSFLVWVLFINHKTTVQITLLFL